MTPPGRRPYIFDSQPKRVDAVDSEGEEEFKETLKKDRRINLSGSPINSARRRALKSDAVKERPKIFAATNVTSSRGQSMKASVDERISNVCPAERGKNYKGKTFERSIFLLLFLSLSVDPFYRCCLRVAPVDVSTIT